MWYYLASMSDHGCIPVGVGAVLPHVMSNMIRINKKINLKSKRLLFFFVLIQMGQIKYFGIGTEDIDVIVDMRIILN
ncbi:hypothetical protein LAZ67_8001109 [Cordylochernes scorpioides]|uniref:Uncharacterized protein n=1 Tax=Cordylochernes scorpioides TaxID=51811 RepID=A0ABY6KRW4_9ARAC|nr:hypothetical protein LAZ67_8001109 [Cordylochernes scorpioides]